MIEKFSVNNILRYGYSGFLMVGIISLVDPNILEKAIKASGPVVTPLAIFFVGTCIFVVYRYVIGEFLLFPIMHLFHWVVDKVIGGTSSPTGYLGELGVIFGERRAAYSEIRRDLLKDEERERFNFAHSETHILYITAIELGVAFLIIDKNTFSLLYFFLFGAILTFLSAIITDIQQHRVEYKILRHFYKRDKLIEFLTKRGYAKVK